MPISSAGGVRLERLATPPNFCSAVNLLDVVLALALVSALVGGYRIGLVARVASWIGALGGFLLALRVLPDVLQKAPKNLAPAAELFLTLGVLLIGAALGGAVGEMIGSTLRRAVPPPARIVDRSGGAVAGVVGVLVGLWLFLRSWPRCPAPPPSRRGPRGSSTPSTRSRPPARRVAGGRNLIGDGRIPDVFDDLRPAPRGRAAAVGGPGTRRGRGQGVRRRRTSRRTGAAGATRAVGSPSPTTSSPPTPTSWPAPTGSTPAAERQALKATIIAFDEAARPRPPVRPRPRPATARDRQRQEGRGRRRPRLPRRAGHRAGGAGRHPGRGADHRPRHLQPEPHRARGPLPRVAAAAGRLGVGADQPPAARSSASPSPSPPTGRARPTPSTTASSRRCSPRPAPRAPAVPASGSPFGGGRPAHPGRARGRVVPCACPLPALVVLVGARGAGKSTWAAANFGRPGGVVRRLRALVGEGEHDQRAGHRRLRRARPRRSSAGSGAGSDRGRQPRPRRPSAGRRCRAWPAATACRAIAVVFDTPAAVCRARNRRARPAGAGQGA